MKKISLGQEWVTNIVNSEIDDDLFAGTSSVEKPGNEALKNLFLSLARSETALEISRRKWITTKSKSPKERVVERGIALNNFLYSNNEVLTKSAMFRGRRENYKRKLIEEVATKAWLIRIGSEAADQNIDLRFNSDLINDDFVHKLVLLSNEEKGPFLACETIRDIGIRVVIEKQLPGMSVDGVSFHTKELGPVIGMTLRYNRLDNFWFTLLHELGHIILHLREPSDIVFIDSDEEENDELEQEAEANAFAKDSLIPRDIWQRSDARRLATKNSVLQLAQKLGIHPSVVAGRLRYERRDFTLLPQLIGQGEVGHLFN